MIKHIAVVLTNIILCGCGSICSLHPVGETPVNLQEHKVKWEGTWLADGGVISIKVTNATNGILAVAMCDRNQGKWICNTGTVYLREGGGWTFANYELTDETNRVGYIWGKVKHDDNQILFWLPDETKIKALVENGDLPGTVERAKTKSGDNMMLYAVMLGDLNSQHIDMITAETNGVLLHWESPIAFVKQSQRNDTKYLLWAQKRLARDLK